MNKQTNTSPDFRTRLIAFAIVLAVGFFMGWFNGRSATSNPAQTGIVAQGTTERPDSGNEQPTQQQQPDEGTETTPTEVDTTASDSGSSTVAPAHGPTVTEDGTYTSKDEVALYIHTYGHLPSNFISKTKARDRGWVASEGNLDEVCPGMSIGGSRFYDDDEDLPHKKGRRWTECDINYDGGYRGSERIVFSNDGLVFYTADHYETFERLY